MLELLKNWIRKRPRVHALSQHVFALAVLRFSDSRRFARYRLAAILRRLSGLIVHDALVGGLMTDDGDYYLRMPDGIFVWYNFLPDEHILGDGQSLEFRPAAQAGESDLERFIRTNLDNESTYFDVGANNGYFYTLKVAKHYPGCRVHAFEPNPRILRALAKNIRFNHAANVTVRTIALSDFTGVAQIPAFMGASGYVVSGQPPQPAFVDIEVSTLDSYVEEHNISRLDLLKVDIEGGEYRFLKGGQDTLRKLRPLMVIELRENLLRRSGASVADVLSILEGADYLGYRVQDDVDTVFIPRERSADFAAQKNTAFEPLRRLPLF